MRDVERAKMVPRGMTSETLTSATLLVVSFGGKYKPASFALWCGSGSVVCWVCTFVSSTASNSGSIFHSKSLLNQQYDFSSSLWVFLIVFNLWLSLHELRVCHQRIKLVSQSCLTLWTPWTIQSMEFSRLEHWSGSLSLSRGSSQPRDRTQVSRMADGFFTSWATGEAQEYWSGYWRNRSSLFLLQPIFLTQESSWGLLHDRWILYQWSYEGSPHINCTSVFKNFKKHLKCET